jgi:hypothetical protein
VKNISPKACGMIKGMIGGGAIAFIILPFIRFNGAAGTLDFALIALSSLIFGLIGYLWPLPAKKREKIQFSLARLLLATAMVALVFGVMKIWIDFKDPTQIIATSSIALAAGGLVLVTNRRNYMEIYRTILLFFVLVAVLALVIRWAASF